MEFKMNDMECPNNPGFGHGFSGWRLLNDEIAVGTCKFCGKEFERSATESIKKEIIKQNYCNGYVDKFLNTSLDDNSILLVLDTIFDECVNFIDSNRRQLLCQKIYQLFSYSIISGEENEQSIKIITEAIKNNDLASDTFLDELERFRNLNLDLINLSSENVVSYSR